MSKPLKPGDIVQIRKPEDTSSYPGWVEHMDKYDGAFVTVKKNIQASFYIEESKYYTFSTKWIVEQSQLTEEDSNHTAAEEGME